jgi:hypothetical protein
MAEVETAQPFEVTGAGAPHDGTMLPKELDFAPPEVEGVCGMKEVQVVAQIDTASLEKVLGWLVENAVSLTTAYS